MPRRRSMPAGRSGSSAATAPASRRCSKLIRGELAARWRRDPAAARRAHRLPWRRRRRAATRRLLETVLAADHERARLLAEAETATEAATHRRDPRRGCGASTPCGAGARRAPSWPGSASTTRRSSAACSSILRRLAHARGAGRRAVRRARPAAARRADQPSRPRGDALARRVPAALSRHADLVSHDRDLLDSVGRAHPASRARQAHALQRRLRHFVRTRARDAARQQRRWHSKQEAAAQALQAFVDRFRYKATKARQAQSRLKMLARLQPIAALVDGAAVPLRLPRARRARARRSSRWTTSRSATRRASRCCAGLDLRIDPDDRIALLGANGNGKSTLAQAARRPARSRWRARSRRAPKLRVGYFAQHQLEELDAASDADRHMARLMPEADVEQVRAQLGALRLPATRPTRRARKLSGGEKARLMLALHARRRRNLLILDEPTNHLDIDAREALVDRAQRFRRRGGADQPRPASARR